jgi:DNA-binding GntR family transcriptional regulator
MNAERKKTTYAYEKLRELLQEELIEKGRIIPTNEIAEMVQLGRAPVLEALKRLESDRHVRIIPQKGIMVREMTSHEMREISDVRIAMEGFIVRKIASAFNEYDVNQVNELLYEQKIALNEDDPRRFIKADEVMHLYLCEKCGNTLFLEEMQRLRGRFFTAGLYILMRPDRMKPTLEEHQRILAALASHDAELAHLEMVTHLENGKMRLT